MLTLWLIEVDLNSAFDNRLIRIGSIFFFKEMPHSVAFCYNNRSRNALNAHFPQGSVSRFGEIPSTPIKISTFMAEIIASHLLLLLFRKFSNILLSKHFLRTFLIDVLIVLPWRINRLWLSLRLIFYILSSSEMWTFRWALLVAKQFGMEI